MKSPRRKLYVRPARAPKWWPRDGRRVAWVGVLKGGIGWVLGDGDPMTPRQLAAAKLIMRFDYRGAQFREEGKGIS